MSRRSRQIAVAVVLAASGCDVAFDLERDPPPALEGYDRCGAFLYSDPLRYAAISAPVAGPWSWDDARAACQLRGMDLAVLNDLHEFASSQNESWPWWIGEKSTATATTTVDGCPAVDAPVARRLVADDAPACGLVTGPQEIDSVSCDGALPGDMGVVVQAMCETPRPDDLACVGNDPAITQYVMSDGPMAYAAAEKFCAGKGGHVVVAETAAEWKVIAQQEHPFWIGSQLRAGAWETSNGCPATYSWTRGGPGTPADGSCVAARTSERGQDEGSGVVVDGVEPTLCEDGSSYALCEID